MGSDSNAGHDCLVNEPAIRRERAIIGNSQGVIAESLSVGRSADGKVRISFELATEPLVGEPKAPIHDKEPVVFVYSSADSIGVSAPEAVLSGRVDFPRDLGHLNAVPADSPASFCLARAGLQPLYDRYGVEAVLERLRCWLRDAQTGSLMADGWEPVPFGIDARIGTLDGAAFQDLALQKREQTNWTTGCACVFLPEHGDIIQIFPREFRADTPKFNSELACAILSLKDVKGKVRVGVPWIFLWTPNVIQETFFSGWKTYSELRQSLEQAGLLSILDTAIGTVLANGCDCKHAPNRKSLILLLGVLRPKPIVSNIFGLSQNPAARNLEIKAYSIEAKDIIANIVDDDAHIREVIAWPVPSRDLFQWVSGVPDLSPATIIGYGALGSAIADHLLRAGIKEITVIDNDRIFSHNLARHRAVIGDIGRLKVDNFKSAVDNLVPKIANDAVTRSFGDDITTLPDEMLIARFAASRLIIDSTADERARIRLVRLGEKVGRQIARLELYDKGRLGLAVVTGPKNNPDLFDLFYLFLRTALNNDGISEALRREQFGRTTVDELLFGFGCASATTRLPNFVVAQHAAAFMPGIVDGLSKDINPGIGVNLLDEQFRPKGWLAFEVPQLEEFRPGDVDGWAVRIHPEVVDFLNEQRRAALPSETGGYLYGGYDPALKRIIVVEASGLPPNSKASGSFIKLGPAGKTGRERRLQYRTAGRVILCGTWHTHPDASAAMSTKDRRTIGRHADLDYANGVPTLLVIAAEGDFQVHLRVQGGSEGGTTRRQPVASRRSRRRNRNRRE